jgi:TatD DNase family protein
MTFLDSHCHLELKDFSTTDDEGRAIDEREAVIARAQAAGVTELVCIGSGASLDEVRNAVHMAETHERIWAAVGIHPHDVARMPEGALAEVERLATSHPKVVAVGETGLDYYYDHSPRERQREVFRAFLGIARRAGRPVSLHIRDAHADAQAILEEEDAAAIGGAVHCFTGTVKDAERYLELGLHISFSGVVTFKSAGEIRAAAAMVPIARLLIETDCPYLAPVPMRGKRNEPAFLVHTAATIAQVLNTTSEIIGAAAADNARRLFRLGVA